LLSSKEILTLKSSFLDLLGHVFFFLLHQVERMKLEELVVRLSLCRESDWCTALVVVMNILRYIRCRDKVSPSRVVGGSPTPIGGGTCPGQLWVASAISQPSSHVLQASFCRDASASCLEILFMWRAIRRDEGVFTSGSADESLSSRVGPLFCRAGTWCEIIIVVSWGFHSDRTRLPYVSCQNLSRAWGVVMAS